MIWGGGRVVAYPSGQRQGWFCIYLTGRITVPYLPEKDVSPVYRITHTSENITFPCTSSMVVNETEILPEYFPTFQFLVSQISRLPSFVKICA